MGFSLCLHQGEVGRNFADSAACMHDRTFGFYPLQRKAHMGWTCFFWAIPDLVMNSWEYILDAYIQDEAPQW